MRDLPVHKALTFRASSIGDSLMGKYFLENIHAAYPEAHLSLLVGSRSNMIKDLFAAYPWLHIREVNRRNPASVIRAMRELKGEDITLTPHSENYFSLPSKLFGRLVTKRGGFIGFDDHFWGNRYLYDTLIPFEGEERSRGMIEEEKRALEAAHIPIGVPELGLQYVEDSNVLSRFGLEQHAYIIAHLFAGTEGRSISQTKRATLVKALRDVLPTTYTLVLTGTQAERDRLQNASEGLPGVSVLAGNTTLQELMNLVVSARGTVALDSGTAHIAAHLKTPLVVLTRKAALHGWWSEAMYKGKPLVLTNLEANDQDPSRGLYPPSLETIEISKVLQEVVRF